MIKKIFLTFFDLKTKPFKIERAQLCYSYKTSIYSTVQTSIYSTVHVYSFHQTLIKLCYGRTEEFQYTALISFAVGMIIQKF